MKQLYNRYTHDLAWLAVDKCFQDKWRRNDVLSFIEEWAGVDRRRLWKDELENSIVTRNEVRESLAYVLDDVVADIQRGRYPDLDPVSIRPRPDGMTGKIRNIAYLCIMHQLLGHVAKLGLDPLLHARILPTQHASLPGHGQTGLVRQTQRYLRSSRLGIACYQKTDCTNAYGSLQYKRVIALIRREIPSAKWLLKLLDFLATMAPGGHLIIGGYLDAWLFNLAMSYAIRDTLSQGKTRRGKFLPYVERIESFMDDFALLGRTPTGLRRALQYLTRWMQERLSMAVRATTGIIRWLSSVDEHARRHAPRPAARGCPGLDMAGYRICRTHITMRRRVVKRVIRAFARARSAVQAGHLPIQRAGSLIARNGPVHFIDSHCFDQKYDVARLVRAAKRLRAWWQRRQGRKRKERLIHAVFGRTSQPAPQPRAAGAPA